MNALIFLLPEIYLVATALGLVVAESSHHGERVRLALPTSLLGISGALIQVLLSYRGGPTQIFAGTLTVDGFTLFFKMLFLALAAIVVTSACIGHEIPRRLRSEFCSLALLGTVALMLAASSSNLFVTVLALQLAGCVGYFLAGFQKESARSAEASVKWMMSSLVSGVFLLLGAMVLFLMTGTVNLYELSQLLSAGGYSAREAVLVFSIIFLGLSMPMMIFPGHLWAADVLQGANTAAGTYLAAGLRAATFAVASRVWVIVFSSANGDSGRWLPMGGWDWTRWLGFSAAMTLVLPALMSVRQQSAKRLLACVATVQGGFLLLGLLVLEEIGLAAVLFGLLVELLSFGGLMFVLSLAVSRSGSDELDRLRGCLRGRPWESVALLLCSIAWVGLPPFAGQIGRFALMGAAVRREWFILAFVGLLATVLTVGAMGRLMLTVLDLGGESRSRVVQGSAGLERTPFDVRSFLVGVLVPLATVTILADWLLRWTSHSLKFIFW